jgi:hypothetical protein
VVHTGSEAGVARLLEVVVQVTRVTICRAVTNTCTPIIAVL